MPTSFHAMNHPPLETAAIHRSKSSGRLCFLLADEGGWGTAPLTLYSSPRPQYDPEQSAFAATVVPGQEVSFPDPAPGRRIYYHLCQNGQYLLTTAERVLPLAGVSNFRDLGGYRTAEGRYVQWGSLYRSPELSDLTPDDLDYLDSLHLRQICDLRDSDEVAAMPSPPLAPAVHTHIPLVEMLGKDVIRQPGDVSEQGRAPASKPGQLLVDMNRSLVHSTAGLRSIFDHLLAENGAPLLFHCTAGKDRTGLVAALLLLTLGVPLDTVMTDYLLTNRYLNTGLLRSKTAAKLGTGKVSNEVLDAVWEARSEYLEAAFAEIGREYGDIGRFVSESLGLSAEEIAALKDKLLTAQP
ncbi:protein-tyrosine-phosphatase [Paenibacillus dendritiformis]|uniref:tyrosine-protein phosphatase n=1 Tax=Paenibacillus dendritiformis TaxID=130049 RepID=UPI001B21C6CD|nr:tyrosine-protein phosphatase [Paenibacillus dendritiformis]GIO73777.1 protein-tyrosine-phosphatase [Paenibacillus dendritiformis]